MVVIENFSDIEQLHYYMVNIIAIKYVGDTKKSRKNY
jgi:hypothetical protein